MLVPMMLAMQVAFCGASYPYPVLPCNIELTDGTIFVGDPFLPVAVGLKAAGAKDPRVAHPDATHWGWNYRSGTTDLVSLQAENRARTTNIQCLALDDAARRAWVSQGGGEDIPAATLMCTLKRLAKNGNRALLIALNADLEVLAAKQLWRPDEGTMLCHLPRKPPPASPASAPPPAAATVPEPATVPALPNSEAGAPLPATP